jgi:Ca2+-binding EF-hand superfamily protein
VINLVGGEEPSTDDIQDIFNLLDVNGDETIDRREFKSLITTFFQILKESKIEVGIERESDLA